MRVAAAAFLTFVGTAAAAQMPPPAPASAPGAPVVLSGKVAHARSFTPADFAGLPAVSAEVPVSGKGDTVTVKFTGVALWPLLDAAGWQDLPGRKTHLQHVVLVRGQDGYAVALAIGELDPTFEGKQVIIATNEDGKPLPQPELVVPGDKKAGRRVKNIAGIEVQ